MEAEVAPDVLEEVILLGDGTGSPPLGRQAPVAIADHLDRGGGRGAVKLGLVRLGECGMDPLPFAGEVECAAPALAIGAAVLLDRVEVDHLADEHIA